MEVAKTWGTQPIEVVFGSGVGWLRPAMPARADDSLRRFEGLEARLVELEGKFWDLAMRLERLARAIEGRGGRNP